jgi:hypothetical protein
MYLPPLLAPLSLPLASFHVSFIAFYCAFVLLQVKRDLNVYSADRELAGAREFLTTNEDGGSLRTQFPEVFFAFILLCISFRK